MQYTKDSWEDFVKTLNKAHTQDLSGTSNPIFVVQEKEVIWGKDLEHSYDVGVLVTPEGSSYANGDELYACLSALEKHELNGESLDMFSDMFLDLNEDNQVDVLVEWDSNYSKLYGSFHWSDVCSHLTKESAERYIKENAHNHKELRVYVKSMNRCPEMIALVQGILDGKIGLIEEANYVGDQQKNDWILVPKEPTVDMMIKGCLELDHSKPATQNCHEIYKAMVNLHETKLAEAKPDYVPPPPLVKIIDSKEKK